MNRHLFGSAHGVSLDVFNQQKRIPAAEQWHILKHDTSMCARIISEPDFPPNQMEGNNDRRLTELPTLLIRWQVRIYMSPVQPRIEDIGKYIANLCPHRLDPSPDDDFVLEMVACIMSHPDEPVGCDYCGVAVSCLFCPTDFTVELEGDAENTAVLITAWANVGDGRTTWDNRWWSLAGGFREHYLSAGCANIRAAFLERDIIDDRIRRGKKLHKLRSLVRPHSSKSFEPRFWSDASLFAFSNSGQRWSLEIPRKKLCKKRSRWMGVPAMGC